LRFDTVNPHLIKRVKGSLIKRMKFLFLGIIGILLILIIIREINTFRVKALWESVRDECEQKGLSFNFSDIIPDPVPEDKNFAYVAALKPLLEYESDGVTPLDPEKYEQSSSFLSVPNDKNWPSNFGAKGPEIYHDHDLRSFQNFFRDDGIELWSQPVEVGEPADDVLLAIGKVSENMDSLVEASKKRPFYRIDKRYEVKNINNIKDIDTVIGGTLSFSSYRNVQRWFNLRSLAHLQNGNVDSAFSDLKMSMFLAELNKNELGLVSQLCRITLMRSALVPLWKGLSKKSWNLQQLESLENILADINYLEGLESAMRFERQLLNGIHHYLGGLLDQNPDNFTASLASFGVPLALVGDGGLKLFSLKWFYISPLAFINGSQARSNELYLKFLDWIVDLESRQIIPDAAKEFDQYFKEANFDKFHPYNFLISLFFSDPVPLAKKIGQMQNLVDQARIACALELYYLEEGKYPKSLDELGEDLPHDVFTGDSYYYVLEGKRKYRIYGLGWNLKDDGGKVSASNSQSDEVSSFESLDVIWQNFPAPPHDKK